MFYYFSLLILIILIITDIDKRGLICDEYMNGSEDLFFIDKYKILIYFYVCVFFLQSIIKTTNFGKKNK